MKVEEYRSWPLPAFFPIREISLWKKEGWSMSDINFILFPVTYLISIGEIEEVILGKPTLTDGTWAPKIGEGKVLRVLPSGRWLHPNQGLRQFLRDQASDSDEVVTPLMLDGTYLSRNFATLGPTFWQPPCNLLCGCPREGWRCPKVRYSLTWESYVLSSMSQRLW